MPESLQCSGGLTRPEPDGSCRYCGQTVPTFTNVTGEARLVDHDYDSEE